MSGRFSVAGLGARYGRTAVLHDVALPALRDGEMLGVLGPNASGKSTLMRRLSGEMPGPGDILLDGRTQRRHGREGWRRAVAAAPQTPPAPSALMPTELMWSTARALGLALSDAELAARIEGIFDELGLSAVALAPLATLSGGKRQLVGLALALIRDPVLLLLDEPTSALDLHWRLAVLDLVRRRLRARGGLVVAALHDLDLAARYCDRLAVLHAGRVLAAGCPAEVLTPDLLARVYRVEAEVSTDPEGRPIVRALRAVGPGEGD